MDRQERLRRRRELYRLRRAEETPQEREVRLARRRERERVRRATLSVERRQSILDQRRERYQHSRNSNAGPTSDNPIEVTVRAVDDHHVIQTVIQKLLISTIGERDYSSQETCHILLQLPMFKTSRDYVVLSLDGSRMIQQNCREGELATVHSILDHYIRRPSTLPFNDLTLHELARNYSMPSHPGTQPVHRRKNVIVIVRPYYPPDQDGPDYQSYCRQKLMLHVTFRRISDLLGAHQTYAEAYSSFLQSTNVPSCLQDDVYRLEQQQDLSNADSDTNEVIHNALYVVV